MDLSFEFIKNMTYPQFIAFVCTVVIPSGILWLRGYKKDKEAMETKIQTLEDNLQKTQADQAVQNTKFQLEISGTQDLLKKLEEGQERMLTRLEAKLDTSVSELRGIVIQEISKK